MLPVYAAAFAIALAASLGATPVARKLALRLNLLDQPHERKVHADPVPYLGGLAIVVGFGVSVSIGVLALSSDVFRPSEGLGAIASSYLRIAVVLGGALLLSGMGLWDDLRVVPGWIKVPVEVALGLALFLVGIKAQLFDNAALDLILTVGWVVGITNAVNYMDNMDGLLAGVSSIAATFFLSMAVLSDQILVAGLAAALAGCALGFLWHNRPPARIFMGDTGSLFLGFLLAAIGLQLKFDNLARVTFFVPIAVMAVPILDALLVSASRVVRGLSPIQPGRDHASHRLVRIGLPPRAAVGLLYVGAAACGWLGLVISYSRPLTAYMLMGFMIAVGVLLGALLLRIEVD